MRRTTDAAVYEARAAGRAALAQARAAGKCFVLIVRGRLRTNCVRVGCSPAKTMIQVTDDCHARRRSARIRVGGEDSLQAALKRADRQPAEHGGRVPALSLRASP